MAELIYTYDGSFEGFLCCIFESYARHEIPTAIDCEADALPTLFATRHISTDQNHANRVYRKVVKLSPYTANLLREGFLTILPSKELHLYHLVVKLLEEGAGFLRNLSDETLYPVLQAVRHLHNEAHLLKGFVRFSELGGVLGCEIEPKNRVLPLLRSHFCARYQNESFFIYDRTHREALFYAAGRAAIQPLDQFKMAPPDETEAAYRLLWKRFYDTISIQERSNPVCRRTRMPQRYWTTMTEFQDEDYFKAQSSPAAVSAPGAPVGISAPGTRPKPAPSAPASAP
ncbi:MAG: TIGR03915 family putative DNA repair protein [Oscillibacter sp.]